MDFMDVIEARRSVRSYSDKEVEEEKLTTIFESARIAPSWANKQCWSYILVRDKEKIKKTVEGTCQLLDETCKSNYYCMW